MTSRHSWRRVQSWIVLLFLGAGWLAPLHAQQSRAEIADRFKWNLADIYPTPEAWRAKLEGVGQRIAAVEGYKGTLAQSPARLLQALNDVFTLRRTLDKLYVYAYLNAIQDLRQSGPQAMQQEVDACYTALGGKTAFLEPEILAMTDGVLDSFLKAEPGLEPYRVFLTDIVRDKPHRLSAEREWVVSRAGSLTGLAGDVHDVLTAAELPWGRIRTPQGTEAVIDIPGYERYRTSPMPEVRVAAFQSFYSSLRGFRGLFAMLLNGKIRENLFYRDVRRYDTVLDSYLFPQKIPRGVYIGLIDSVHRALPTLHRYMRLKKRLLGLSELHYHDLYPEWSPGARPTYAYDQTRQLLERALAVLGPEYGAYLQRAFNERWIDFYPSPGKISGASCEGCYDTHPFVKLNDNGGFGDVSMAAHELGHAMHACFTNKNQAYPNSAVNSLVAETAATVNSSLLSAHVIAATTDKKQKMALLGSVLETFRQSLFRQCLFAEFEYRVHQEVEAGKTLSADDFDRIYLGLLRTYYGHDQGVVIVDDLYKHEWCYISHYFLGFYHYFYCTSFIAANSIADRLLNESAAVLPAYLNYLSCGNRVDPLPLLQSVGVDMNSARPMAETISRMNHYLDIAEQTAAELAKK